MKKVVFTLIFFAMCLGLIAQTTFQITNGVKSKTIDQTDFFTFYLKDSPENSDQQKRVYEGYILSATDKQYEIKVFFEEYESYDSLVIDRCTYQGACDKVILINLDQLEMFQRNKSSNVSTARWLFGLSALALVSSAVLEFNSGLFKTNGSADVPKRRFFVGSSLGASLISFGVGMDLLNTKKYYTDTAMGRKGGWYIK